GALRLVELVDQEGELGRGLAPALLLGAVEERGERAAHDRAVARAGRLEFGRRLGAAKAEPARQREERVRVARHALGAPLLDDLQLVLDVAQEAVGGGEPLAERAVPAHRTGLQPRGALPRLPPGLVVRERRRERDGDRPLAAARAEPEIDAEDEAVARDLAERARHLLGEAREELPERAA